MYYGFIDAFYDETNSEEDTSYLNAPNKFFDILITKCPAMTKAMQGTNLKIVQGNYLMTNLIIQNISYSRIRHTS